MPATATAPEAPAKPRMMRRKSDYILQISEKGIWGDFVGGTVPDSFKDDASARKFVRDGQHVGRFRVIRVVSEFTSAIEEKKVVRLT